MGIKAWKGNKRIYEKYADYKISDPFTSDEHNEQGWTVGVEFC